MANPVTDKRLAQIAVTNGHAIDTTWPDIRFRLDEGVIMTPAITYSTPPSSRPLSLDLYRKVPTNGNGAGATPPAPIIIFIHGGSWARGDSRASRPFRRFPWVLASIAARGYVVASINYRLVGEALWPAQGRDVNAAVRFLRKNAAEFGGDPRRIATWGVSCGGHLSAVAATMPDIAAMALDDESLADVDAKVQAAVSWYGGFNMETITAQSQQVPGCYDRADRRMPEWNLLGGMPGEVEPALLQSASPARFVGAATAPMLIVVGDQDILIPYHQSIEMAERMTAAGVRAQLEVIEGVGHDFAGATPEHTLAANKHALAMTLAFIERELKPSG